MMSACPRATAVIHISARCHTLIVLPETSSVLPAIWRASENARARSRRTGTKTMRYEFPELRTTECRMCARTSFGRALTATGGTPWRPWGPVTEGVDQAGLWDVSRRAGTLRLSQVPEVYLKSRCEGVPGALRKKSRSVTCRARAGIMSSYHRNVGTRMGTPATKVPDVPRNGRRISGSRRTP